jgi:hypothetical protein
LSRNPTQWQSRGGTLYLGVRDLSISRASR